MKRWWIGGSPCAGKSSIAQRLADQVGLTRYQVDAHTNAHMLRSSASNQPTFHRLNQLAGDDLWLRPLSEQVEDEIAYCAEQFSLIIEDWSEQNADQSTIVEGASLLPNLVAPLLQSPREAIWLVPSESFQRHQYAQRGWAKEIVSRCSDPEQAWENWMQRDVQFAYWVAEETDRLGLKCIIVDGSIGLEEMSLRVQEWLKL